MIRALLATICLLAASPAFAGLTKAEIGKVGVFPPKNAALPLSLSFHDENGKTETLKQLFAGAPAIVIFADYTCKTLCGPILEMTSAALAQSELKPGHDFHLIVIGMDPNDNATEARAFTAPQIDPKIGAATDILLGNRRTISTATRALGYRYVYDRQHDQFAHPTTAFVMTPDGKLSKVLSALGLRGEDVRLALVSAGHGAIGTFADRIRLLCYCYDPATGIYSASISRMIDGAAAVTVASLIFGFAFFKWREARKS